MTYQSISTGGPLLLPWRESIICGSERARRWIKKGRGQWLQIVRPPHHARILGESLPLAQLCLRFILRMSALATPSAVVARMQFL